MEYAWRATPFVVVAGLATTSDLPDHKAKQQLDEVELWDSVLSDRPLAEDLAQRISALSHSPGPWEPETARNDDAINFVLTNRIRIASKAPKPSELSPLRPDPIAPIFTVEWVRKYLFFMPTVAIVFCTLPASENAQDALVDKVLSLKGALNRYGTELIVALVGNEGSLARDAPYIRRQTGLGSKSGMLILSDDSGVHSEQVRATFVEALSQAAMAQSQEFFANKMRRIREKRKAVSPPLELLVWDARYTLKLAYCSEFKGDNKGALRLFESTYDSLSLLFEQRAITPESKSYINAREVLDAVAVKIFQGALPGPSAFTKLRIHLLTVEDMWRQNGINDESESALRWEATQYARFAELCSLVKQTTSPDSVVGGVPTGLVWLDAAKKFAEKPVSENDDPYRLLPDERLSAQNAFLNAISNLSHLKRAKAYALSSYAEWLNSTDESAAHEAYKSATKSLPSPMWPAVHRLLSHKLNDKIALFALGEITDLPKDAKTSKEPFFRVSGTFELPETYTGREARAQVTLVPEFPGELKLQLLRIRHTLGQVEFTHDEESGTPLRLITNTETSLRFSGHGAKTFEFGTTALETGEIELLEIEFIAGDEFTQRLPILENKEWLTSNEASPRTVWHLPLSPDHRKINITTRPAKLEIDDSATPALAAAGEVLPFRFTLTSSEPEEISPKVVVSISTTGDVILEKEIDKLAPGGSEVLSGACAVPTSVFELVVKATFETTGDTLSVHKEHRKEIDVSRPFRVNFDLFPERLEQEWPVLFAPTLKLPSIARSWRLQANVLSLFTDEALKLHKSELSISCDTAIFEIEPTSLTIDADMKHNSLANIAHSFVSRKKEEKDSLRTFEAAAIMKLVWSRKSHPEIENSFTLPAVRLNLPTQEPRVLTVVDRLGGDADTTQVTFHVENATARVLNFSISMASSTYFAFQGPKAITLRMLPYTTRPLTYQLTPLGNGSVQNKRPLPELRVYDVNYRKTLAVLSGDKRVTLEQGSLFV